jgi:radical SAM superfamily enzyme YgiQ (UPF0313 family)
MAEIVLATINAKYIHTAFGLRYLYANLGGLQSRAAILEFEIKQRPLEIAAEILAAGPRIVGLGVYIWNAIQTTEVVGILKRVRPDLVVIVGGPEVSYETDSQEIVRIADHVITGEADVKFAEICGRILGGESGIPKVIPAELPATGTLRLPYDFYGEEDLAHRVLYVEASRGCPFTCEFCLSSLDIPVRAFDLGVFLSAMRDLLKRGARVFKFVDRTFNLHLATSRAILEFFLQEWREGMFLHFEMVPDRMPEALLEILGRFPEGTVQLEVGIQTFDAETSRNISRRQNYEKLEKNIRHLRERTGVHIHADLIVGLPGETWESFGAGFDRLVAMGPQEIQVGILKRLRGTPIIRHEQEWAMVYQPVPPYELLQNARLSFEQMQRLRRFARFWDLLANSGRFPDTLPWLWKACGSPFGGFMQFSDWLGMRLGRSHSIALVSLARELFVYLTEELREVGVEEVLRRDWERGGVRRERLAFLEGAGVEGESRREGGTEARAVDGGTMAKRQARHRGAG